MQKEEGSAPRVSVEALRGAHSSFSSSTHRRYWLLTPEEIAKSKRLTRERLRTKQPAQQLTVDEEDLLKLYYEKYILQQVAPRWEMNKVFPATAVMFFKRFYLRHSLVEFCPTHMVAACIYLASKAEEYPISVEALAKFTKLPVQVIVELELPLLHGLSFHIRVYHPYRALQGLLKALALAQGSPPPTVVAQLEEEATRLLDGAFLTDLPLISPPSQIALAALSLAADIIQNPTALAGFYAQFFPANGGVEEQAAIERLKSRLVPIADMLLKGRELLSMADPVWVENCRAADKKLRQIRSSMAQEVKERAKRKREAESDQTTSTTTTATPPTTKPEPDS